MIPVLGEEERESCQQKSPRMGIGPERVPMAQLRRTARQFWVFLALLAVLMTIAAFFYLYVESDLSKAGWTLVDAFYMTLLVVTTIGFAEVHPLSQTGRAFTIGFSIAGIALLALAARSAASLLLSQQLSDEVQRRRRRRILKDMRDHYIVCGCGRMGREVVQQLRRRRLPVVVIEQQAELLEGLKDTGIPCIVGNATEDEHLHEAGVERAKCLIAAVGSDEDSLFVVLSARLLNPSIYIVTRAGRDESVDKLLRAGANSVHSPYVVGGRDLAAAAVEPGVAHFLEEVLHHEEFGVDFRSVAVPEASPVLGKPMLGSGIMQEGAL